MMTRRSLFGLIAAATLDPERLLWKPGAKLISIPAILPFTFEELVQAREFIAGDQWPAEVLVTRKGRPNIVFNWTSDVFYRIIHARPEMTTDQRDAAMVDVYRKLRVSQMLLNLYKSELAELRVDFGGPLAVPYPAFQCLDIEITRLLSRKTHQLQRAFGVANRATATAGLTDHTNPSRQQ